MITSIYSPTPTPATSLSKFLLESQSLTHAIMIYISASMFLLESRSSSSLLNLKIFFQNILPSRFLYPKLLTTNTNIMVKIYCLSPHLSFLGQLLVSCLFHSLQWLSLTPTILPRHHIPSQISFSLNRYFLTVHWENK